MDMNRFLKPYLTVPELEAMGGEYEGVIASVAEEDIRNRYTGQRSNEPVVSFLDGKRLVLNKTTLRACMTLFGSDSNDWCGRRIRVFLRRVETINKETGEMRMRLQRAIACEDPRARYPVKAAGDAVRDGEPNENKDATSSVRNDDTTAMVTAEEIFGQSRRQPARARGRTPEPSEATDDDIPF